MYGDTTFILVSNNNLVFISGDALNFICQLRQ